MATLITKHEAAKLLKISVKTLGCWRREGRLTEGIHFIQLTPRTIRYVQDKLIELAFNDQPINQ
jgi:predicted site-specific integrase-resolvase